MTLYTPPPENYVNVQPIAGSIASSQITIMDQNDGYIADVSSNNFVILTDTAGTPVTDAFVNANGLFTLKAGNLDITTNAGVVLTRVLSNVVATVNTAANTPVNGQPKGYYEITAISASTGYIEITATYNGQTFSKKVYANKVVREGDPANTIKISDNTWISANVPETAYGNDPINEILGLSAGANGYIAVSLVLSFRIVFSPPGTDTYLYVKIQYKLSADSIWIDFPGAVSTGAARSYVDDEFDLYAGGIYISRKDLAAPATPESFDFRVLGYRETDNVPVDTISGTFSAYWLPA